MWKLFTLCIALSLGMVVWLGYEVGALFPRVEAAETGPATDKAPADKGAQNALEQQWQERSTALDQRQANLERKEQMLKEKETILATQVERYEKIISEYKARLVEQDEERKSRADAARQVYEKIEPKKAAKIIEQMDISLATQLMSGMKGEKAAAIYGQMSPERAKEITERFLGRRGIASKTSTTGPSSEDPNSNGAQDASPGMSRQAAPEASGVGPSSAAPKGGGER